MGFETDGSVVGRGVVSLGEGKMVGKVSALAVDPSEMRVSHYVVSSESTGSDLVLPLEKAVSVGNTFLTIEWRADFLPAEGIEAKGILSARFDLAGLPAYSRAGDTLGNVQSFGFTTTTGEIQEMIIEGDRKFERDTFVFASPEFAFFDTGEETDADLRAEAEEVAEEIVEEVAEAIAAVVAEEIIEETAEEEAAAEEAAAEEEATEDAAEEAAEEPEAAAEEPSAEDAELMKFLVGKKLKEGCKSEDDSFTAEAGDVLTEEQVNAAYAAGALLVLAMSVE